MRCIVDHYEAKGELKNAVLVAAAYRAEGLSVPPEVESMVQVELYEERQRIRIKSFKLGSLRNAFEYVKFNVEFHRKRNDNLGPQKWKGKNALEAAMRPESTADTAKQYFKSSPLNSNRLYGHEDYIKVGTKVVGFQSVYIFALESLLTAAEILDKDGIFMEHLLSESDVLESVEAGAELKTVRRTYPDYLQCLRYISEIYGPSEYPFKIKEIKALYYENELFVATIIYIK